MAVSNVPFFPQALLSPPTQFTNSTSTSTPTQILPTKTNGVKLEAILIASTDTSARDFNLYLNVSATNYLIGTVSIPASAGNSNSTPAVNLLSALTGASPLLPIPKDSNGNPYLYLDSSTALYAAPATTITSGKVWNIVVIGESY
jgi:hypothetical protein